MPLDEWQEQVLEAAMGERADGRWAAKFVGMSVPRQNGKSQMIVARALAGILLFGEKVIIISAHETDTAREIWKRLIDVIEANPTLEARVTGRMDAINREYLSFGSGKDRQEIKLKARRANGSRGFSADCLLLDEAQILGKRAWGSIVPTMSARPNPQLWLFGTPPTSDDDPFAFSRVRDSSQAKKARHCWLEWAAEPADDIDDPSAWAKANPSYGVRLTHEAIADDRAAMDDEQFMQERLGIWSTAEFSAVIPATIWNQLTDPGAELEERPTSLAVDMSHDRTVAIAACWRTEGFSHLELVSVENVLDPLEAVQLLQQMAGRRISVVVDSLSPAASLIPELKTRKIKVVVTGASDMAKACGGFYDDVVATHPRLSHAGQPQLDAALAGSKKRSIGDAGGWGWDRKDSSANVAPLVAITLARFGATVTKAPAAPPRIIVMD